MPTRVPPPPSAVAVGVWAAGLPFPNPLGFAYAYSVRVPRGVVVVDMGWDSPECWQAFQHGLTCAGATLQDVVGVVVTHVHPDHYGLAQQVRQHTDAWIAVHPAERPMIADGEHRRVEHVERMAHWLRECGAPDSELDDLRADAGDIRHRISLVQPDYELVDGQTVPDSDGALVAVHTPGHTPGHLCYHDRSRNLLFTGDHILPRVTPNISKRPSTDPDPLADFMTSLERTRQYQDCLVLPGHEWPFDRLGERLDELQRHHGERLDEMVRIVGAGACTVWEVAQAAAWSRPFASLQGRARRSALGETYSHLHRLAVLGRLHATGDLPVRWTTD